MTLLSTAGMGNYATAAAASQRSDLATNYERLSLEIGQYAKDGADIMIQNEWLEQPPGTLDKEELAKKRRIYRRFFTNITLRNDKLPSVMFLFFLINS
ncbi:hypothetical protein GCM10020331_022170 [Ectobacillus funiculus]